VHILVCRLYEGLAIPRKRGHTKLFALILADGDHRLLPVVADAPGDLGRFIIQTVFLKARLIPPRQIFLDQRFSLGAVSGVWYNESVL
jgi:hypothetical protein